MQKLVHTFVHTFNIHLMQYVQNVNKLDYQYFLGEIDMLKQQL